MHEYRLRVFIQRPDYTESLDAIPTLGPWIIKFARNPVHRAVSGYPLYWQQAQHDPEVGREAPALQMIGVYLGRAASATGTSTLREFVSLLSASDLATVDAHSREQVSLCERFGRLDDLTIIPIEESMRLAPEVKRS